MKKLASGFLILLVSGCFQFVKAQDASNPVLMTIAGTPVTKSEFEKVYRKNNNKEGAYDMKDVREYLELYINYKLKVRRS